MKKKDLRKLAEEIAYKYELTDGDGYGTDCVFIDDTIDAMFSFYEQTSKDMYPKEFVEFLQSECEGFNKGWRYYPSINSEIFTDYDSTGTIYQYWKDNIQGK